MSEVGELGYTYVFVYVELIQACLVSDMHKDLSHSLCLHFAC